MHITIGLKKPEVFDGATMQPCLNASPLFIDSCTRFATQKPLQYLASPDLPI